MSPMCEEMASAVFAFSVFGPFRYQIIYIEALGGGVETFIDLLENLHNST